MSTVGTLPASSQGIWMLERLPEPAGVDLYPSLRVAQDHTGTLWDNQGRSDSVRVSTRPQQEILGSYWSRWNLSTRANR